MLRRVEQGGKKMARNIKESGAVRIWSKDPEYFGQKLKRLRQERGFSLADFAKASKIRAAKISWIEEDGVIPCYSTLARIAAALDMPVAQLVEKAKKTEQEEDEKFQALAKKWLELSEEERVSIIKIATKLLGPS